MTMTYDLIIAGGTIVDGTGAPRYRGDIAISDGKIVAIGANDTLHPPAAWRARCVSPSPFGRNRSSMGGATWLFLVG